MRDASTDHAGPPLTARLRNGRPAGHGDRAAPPRPLYDAGCRFLDVANVYRDGESARAVGKWLRARSSRDGIVVYAKGCHPPYCNPDLVAAEVDRALGLLAVDRTDVFILHRDDTAVPVSAWADALLEQVAKGRIASFGVSNWTVARLRELAAHLDAIGDDHLVAFSNHFSLAEMVAEPWPGCLAVTKDEIEALEPLGLQILAWSSLAIGYFAGRASPSWESDVNAARRARARELGAQLGTSATAIALAYALHQADHLLPVVGTRSPAHLDEALAAAALELTEDQLEWLVSGAPVVRQ